MKNKKVFLIIGIIVVVSLGLFVYFRSQRQTKLISAPPPQDAVDQQPLDQPADQPLVEDLPLVDQPASVADSDSSSPTTTVGGVLIGDGNPWQIIYDDPATGSPAATLELVFTDQSRCDFGQGDVSCAPMYYEVGTGIEVTGQKDGSRIIVFQIKRAVNLEPR